MILGAEEQSDNSTIEKYCYGDNPVNCNTLAACTSGTRLCSTIRRKGGRASVLPGGTADGGGL